MRPDLAGRGVTSVTIFGSRAREDNLDESDLDFLIEVEDARTFSLLDLIAVQHIICDDLGLSVNALMRRSLPETFVGASAPDMHDVF